RAVGRGPDPRDAGTHDPGRGVRLTSMAWDAIETADLDELAFLIGVLCVGPMDLEVHHAVRAVLENSGACAPGTASGLPGGRARPSDNAGAGGRALRALPGPAAGQRAMFAEDHVQVGAPVAASQLVEVCMKVFIRGGLQLGERQQVSSQ